MTHEIASYGRLSDETIGYLSRAGFDDSQCDQPIVVQGRTIAPEQRILSAPVILWIELTSQCPLRCRHCFIRPSIDGKGKHLPTQLALSLVRQARDMGIFKITLTGGEALLHPDAFTVIAEINKLGLGLRIFSSGCLSSSVFERLRNHKVDTFFLSMDGMEQHHQYLRGKNSFGKLTKTIHTLSSIDSISNITLSVTIDRENYRRVEDIMAFASNHQVHTLLVRPLMTYAWTKEVSGIAFSDKAELLQALQYIEAVGGKHNIEIQINKLPYFPIDKVTYCEDHRANASLWHILGINESIDCVGGNLVCGVRWDGTLSPCGFLPAHQEMCRQQEILQVNLTKEWKQSPSLTKMHCIPINEECAQCGHRTICNGGCRANSVLAGSGICGIDPYCLLRDTAYGKAMYADKAAIMGSKFPMNEDVFFLSPQNLVSKCGWATYET